MPFFAVPAQTLSKFRAVALTITASVVLLSCSSKNCTNIGCLSGASIHVSLGADYTPLGSLVIRVCHNEDCVEGQLNGPDAGLSPVDIYATFPHNSGQLEVAFHASAAVGAVMDATWYSTTEGNLADGDTYSVKVTTLSGETLVSGEKDVTYTMSYPNGKECGPACLNTKFTVDATGAH